MFESESTVQVVCLPCILSLVVVPLSGNSQNSTEQAIFRSDFWCTSTLRWYKSTSLAKVRAKLYSVELNLGFTVNLVEVE